MVLSAGFVCLSHGSNDVANAISPLTELLRDGGSTTPAFIVGSSGIALGLAVMGKSVMETVGKSILILDFYKGYAAQFSTALCICIGSTLGLPLSTTHCMIGSLAGIYFSTSINRVKVCYQGLQQIKAESDKTIRVLQ